MEEYRSGLINDLVKTTASNRTPFKDMQNNSYILTVSCRDVRGIVAAVAGFISSLDGFIIEASQFGDPVTEQFFQRIYFSAGAATPAYEEIKKRFADEVGIPFAMNFHLHDMSKKAQTLLMVSKFDHCLNDLLHRHQVGSLPMDIPAVVSNHEDCRALVEWHNIPFYYFPLISADKKSEQEAKTWDIVQKHKIELVVLARYMQVLSADLCTKLAGKAINIHHSFLPSFKGARPYHQAHARGVKLIGATAHYVTDDLDEGPIIEQEVISVDHTHSPEDFVAVGRDIESRVLARAVKYHIEHRVLLNGTRTVVFK